MNPFDVATFSGMANINFVFLLIPVLFLIGKSAVKG